MFNFATHVDPTTTKILTQISKLSDQARDGLECETLSFLQSSRDEVQLKPEIQAIISLIRTAVHHKVTVDTFEEYITSNNIQLRKIVEWYGSNLSSLSQEVVKSNESSIPRYLDLEWRTEARISSKMVENLCEPKILLKFELKDCQGLKEQLLSCNLGNFEHVKEVLEGALSESQNPQVQKILRKNKKM